MAGRLAIDFGTCNTVVALWDPDSAQGRTVPLPGFSMVQSHEGVEFHSVPSLIRYEGNRLLVGRQVLEVDRLASSLSTFRWMKTYISNNMRLPRRIGERTIDFVQAAGDFLKQVIFAAGDPAELGEEEVCFTVPVEAFEHYQAWLDRVLSEAGVTRPVFIDEASAAALGYSAGLRVGDAFMVFDFGGGSTDASIVKVEAEKGQQRCRTLGKAGVQIGGSIIDQWVVRHVLAATTQHKNPGHIAAPLLSEAERVKIALSTEDEAEFVVSEGCPHVSCLVKRPAFEDLMEEKGLYTKLNTCLDLAEAQAREYGYERADLKACLMIGGSSLIPSVRRLMRTRYGRLCAFERPFDAVAIGAAGYVAGAGFDDRIRHSYALRPYDREKGDYVYRTIVPAGTPYPSVIMRPDRPDTPLVLSIKASHENQVRLGLQVYEVAHHESEGCSDGLELVYDGNGVACYREREASEELTHRPIGSMGFIAADPPAARGDPRFLASFAIDKQKRLCITVRDRVTERTLMKGYPLVKLI